MSEPLQSTISMPNGGTAARCQARNRAGAQCAKPSRAGFNVCTMHGAGTKKREDAHERKQNGRPPIHSLYSKTPAKGIGDIMRAVEAGQNDLDNTDKEMVVLNSTTSYRAK